MTSAELMYLVFIKKFTSLTPHFKLVTLHFCINRTNQIKMTNETKLWGGRFTEKTAASVEAFTASIHYDSRLYKQDIAGSQAHAKMLVRQGLISAEEGEQISNGLAEIEQEIEVTNRRITDMFDYYYSYGSLIDKNSNSEIGVLVDKLRESIHATASVISEAVGAVKKSKKEIVNNMRNLDNGKAAIHSYAKTRFI